MHSRFIAVDMSNFIYYATMACNRHRNPSGWPWWLHIFWPSGCGPRSTTGPWNARKASMGFAPHRPRRPTVRPAKGFNRSLKLTMLVCKLKGSNLCNVSRGTTYACTSATGLESFCSFTPSKSSSSPVWPCWWPKQSMSHFARVSSSLVMHCSSCTPRQHAAVRVGVACTSAMCSG